MLPADDSSEGLDNIADVLGTSPALIERYIGAAAKVSRLAIGDTDIGAISTTYKVRGDLTQDSHIEGLPIGTRGGILIHHNFPVDGEYLLRILSIEGQFWTAVWWRRQRRATGDEPRWRARRTPGSQIGPYYYIRGGQQGGRSAPGTEAAGQGGTADHHRYFHQEDGSGCR